MSRFRDPWTPEQDVWLKGKVRMLLRDGFNVKGACQRLQVPFRLKFGFVRSPGSLTARYRKLKEAFPGG